MRRVDMGQGYPITFVTADELAAVTCSDADRRDAARALARAAERGFLYCEAVFIEKPEGDVYDGLCEKAHPTSGALDWGRGQRVTERNFFFDGQLVPDPAYTYEYTPEVEWDADGLRCYTHYVTEMGHRNGYVEIPAGHPWHGKGYDQCLLSPPCEESYCEHRMESVARVHGGITFADENWRGAWTIGFDCAHSGDIPNPEFTAEREARYGYDSYRHRDGHYWTLDDVQRETTRLAAQVAAAATGALVVAPEE